MLRPAGRPLLLVRPMPLARIITRSPQASNQLARKLRARGFEVDSRTGAGSYTQADIEFSVEEYSVEDALERATREAGTVFLAPGALVEDLHPTTVIPLMSELVRNAHAQRESVQVPSVLPSVEAKAAPMHPLVEMPVEAIEVSAANPTVGAASLNEESTALEPFVAAEETLPEPTIVENAIPEAMIAEKAIAEETIVAKTIAEETIVEKATAEETIADSPVADLVAEPALREPESANDFLPEFAVLPEVPVLSETLPTLAALTTAQLEEPIPAAEIQPQVIVPEVVENEAEFLPDEETVVAEEVASLPLVARPDIPAEAIEEVPVLQSVVPEPEVPLEPVERVKIPILVPPLATPTERKIRIVLPGIKKNARAWSAAAALFAITMLTVLFISTKPATQAEKVQSPAPQTSLQTQNTQTQNAPAAIPQPVRPARHVSAPSHRAVHTSDEGYIAKDTVIRYGKNGATPGKKPASQSGSR